MKTTFARIAAAAAVGLSIAASHASEITSPPTVDQVAMPATHTLEPGDIIATGTNRRGLNPLMDGDKIELETEGLGKLTFHVKDDLKRTWARKTWLQMHEEASDKTPGNYPDTTPQLTGKYAKA